MDSLIWMTGYVGSEVEHREYQETSYASFRLACTPRVRRGNEWADAETTWIAVTCSRVLADNVQLSIAKGDPVVVAGRLRTQRWTDRDGAQQERITLSAEVIGHDLTRGTTCFTKTHRFTTPGEPINLAELVTATEEQVDQLADPEAPDDPAVLAESAA